MVGIICRFFSSKRQIEALQREVNELQQVILKLLPGAERSICDRIDNEELLKRVRSLEANKLGAGIA